MLNRIVDFIFWLSGVLHVIGCLGGLFFWAFMLWLEFSQRGRALKDNLRINEECRCRDCADGHFCEAAYTGVSFPCPHFKDKGQA